VHGASNGPVRGGDTRAMTAATTHASCLHGCEAEHDPVDDRVMGRHCWREIVNVSTTAGAHVLVTADRTDDADYVQLDVEELGVVRIPGKALGPLVEALTAARRAFAQ
jgi:hypothetical protein